MCPKKLFFDQFAKKNFREIFFSHATILRKIEKFVEWNNFVRHENVRVVILIGNKTQCCPSRVWTVE